MAHFREKKERKRESERKRETFTILTKIQIDIDILIRFELTSELPQMGQINQASVQFKSINHHS